MMWVTKPHDHPFWRTCQECNAAPEYQQILAHLIWVLLIVLGPLWLLITLAGGF
jgi:hypothetical protein